MRVLKWIVDRARGQGHAQETPIGLQPRYDDLHWDGLDFSREKFDELMRIDIEAWKQELLSHEELFLRLERKLPKEFLHIRQLLINNLQRNK